MSLTGIGETLIAQQNQGTIQKQDLYGDRRVKPVFKVGHGVVKARSAKQMKNHLFQKAKAILRLVISPYIRRKRKC